MTHPDNPTNLEAAAEAFQDAILLAKSRVKRVTLPPWEEPRLGSAVIRDLCGEIAQLLIDEWRGSERT